MTIRPMLWLAGADADAVDRHREGARYATFGALIALMSLWSFVAMYTTLHFSLGLSVAASVPGALLFAMIIASVDRLISSLVLERDGFWYRFTRVLLMRGLLSIALGLFVAHATILFVYRADLDHRVHEATVTTRATDVGKVTGNAPEYKQIKADQTQIGQLNSAAASAQLHTDRLRKLWLDDTVPVHGDRAANGDYAGPGNVSTPLKQDYLSYRNGALAAALKAQRTETPTLLADISARKAALQKRIDAAGSAADRSGGYEARNRAFFALLHDDPTVWLIVAFFVMLDLVVTSLKTTWPASEVDRAKRRQSAAAAAQSDYNTTAPEFAEAHAYAAARAAEVYRATVDVDAAEELARLRKREARAHADAAGASTAQGGGAGPRRRRVVAGTLASLLVLAGGGLAGLLAANGGDTSTTARSGAAHAAASSPVAAAGLQLTRPAETTAAAAKRYMQLHGAAIMRLHRASATLVAGYTPARCRSGRAIVESRHPALTPAIAGIPDPQLYEIALDEVHDVTAMGSCGATAPGQHLASIDALMTQRLRQIGVEA